MHRVAAIGGDGIGPEIIAAGRTVLDAAGERYGFDIAWEEFDIGADRYLATGELLTEDELADLSRFKAIYFGAIGDDRVKPGILEKGILLAIRFHFDQYINLRPIKLLEGVWTPLAGKGPENIDFVVVRENTEDFYVGIGSRFSGRERRVLEVERELYQVKFGLDIETDADELAYQIGVVTREGSARVIRYAFDLARARKKKLASVDKANVLSDVYGLWRDVFSGIAAEYPDVSTEFNFVDAVTMWFVKNPEWYDVVVTPNMFGDIITDLGAMIQGGLGLAPGGNINPDGTSMFEPIHGSAPKYRGMNIANPLATIWAGSMLLSHLGEEAAAAAVLRGIEQSIAAGVVTKDMGGAATTSGVGDYVASAVRSG
ncbi:MAG: 3-isopropylmalate dehydrogenase [Methanomicrobiaceae archaeon]|nr:3-isopropylmalate dehydrogenase [Methanomicrobiaceae archaeon]MDD5419329.1 isocitrate/isopropylmalate family dehydrogenase [Methanomicrobiaceae archaeon]